MPQLDEVIDGQAKPDVIGEADVGLAVGMRSEPDDDASGSFDLGQSGQCLSLEASVVEHLEAQRQLAPVACVLRHQAGRTSGPT